LNVGFFAQENARLMTPEFASYAWSNDQRIQKITGQSFTETYRQKVLTDFTKKLDSWFPTLAISAHETRFPEKGYDMLSALQKARFVEGQDVTNPEVLSEIATSLGWQKDLFDSLLRDQKFADQVSQRTEENRKDFSQYQASGVPLVIIAIGGEEKTVPPSFIFNKNPDPQKWPGDHGP
jgi:putative protein-disulfide isomerase